MQRPSIDYLPALWKSAILSIDLLGSGKVQK